MREGADEPACGAGRHLGIGIQGNHEDHPVQRLAIAHKGGVAGVAIATQQPIELHQLAALARSEEHTSELQSLMRISYAVFCLKKKNNTNEIKRPVKKILLRPTQLKNVRNNLYQLDSSL